MFILLFYPTLYIITIKNDIILHKHAQIVSENIFSNN